MSNSFLRATLTVLLCLLISQQVICLTDLPKTFAWGVTTTAYQIEGAWDEDGKKPNIWDVYTAFPDVIYQNQTGQVADDFYHRYNEDIDIMVQIGLENSGMSIAWSRILPDGTTDNVNQVAVQFYRTVLTTLISKGIQPWVTIYQGDLPAALNDRTETGGWLNPNIVDLYADYADFLFETFGDLVTYWLTFNEIMEWTWGGYGDGSQAPGRCSPERNPRCLEIGGGGNSSTEPYIAAHHALLAHARVVDSFRSNWKPTYGGYIGMTMDCAYALPYNPASADDRKAADDFMTFWFGWIIDPIVFGKYPDIMVEYVTDNRLPTFTDEESQLIKGSYDFLGLDFYTSTFVQYTGVVGTDYGTDKRSVQSSTDVYGTQIGPLAGNEWLYVYPVGLRKMLRWIANRYNNAPIYIFENGVPCPGENDATIEVATNDTFRIDYLNNHIANTIAAKEIDGVDVRGYHYWSITDNFEWTAGYSVRFGLVYINYTDLSRTLKLSANVYSKIINGTVIADIEKEKQDDPTYVPTYDDILTRLLDQQ